VTDIDIDKLEALAKQRDESAEYEYDNDRWRCRGCGRLDTRCECDEMLAASVPALIAEIRRLRAIEAAAREVAANVEDDIDARLRYVVVQPSREEWLAFKAALAAKENHGT